MKIKSKIKNEVITINYKIHLNSKIIIYLLTFFALSSLANAHIIPGTSFTNGALHPLTGFDHLLAILAVGIIATQLGGKAIWIVPLTFISAMIFGGIVGILGFQISFVELGIALSIIFSGLAIIFSKKLPAKITLVCIGLAAFFHGHAHGSEMAVIFNPVIYMLGFVLSTAVLHISGIFIGQYAQKSELRATILKFTAAGISFTGIILLFGFIAA